MGVVLNLTTRGTKRRKRSSRRRRRCSSHGGGTRLPKIPRVRLSVTRGCCIAPRIVSSPPDSAKSEDNPARVRNPYCRRSLRVHWTGPNLAHQENYRKGLGGRPKAVMVLCWQRSPTMRRPISLSVEVSMRLPCPSAG